MDGPSGSGKTTLILNIMQQLQADGVPWLALDWKRSFRVLMHDAHGEDVIVLTVSTDVAPLRINMLLPPPGVSTAAWVDNLSDTICSGYSLMDGAQSALKAAFFDAFSQYGKRANLRDALVFVQQQKAYVPQRSRNYGWMESTERALKQLTTGSFGDCLNEREHPMLVGELLRMKVAIELVGLGQAQGAKKKIPEIIAALAGHQMSEHHRKMIRYSLSHMKFIEDQIEEIDRDIAARFRRRAWIGNGRSCRPCRECSNAAPRRSSPRPERT
jgi:hypothetical protein